MFLFYYRRPTVSFRFSTEKQVCWVGRRMTLELKCPRRCWRSICQPTPRSTAGRWPRSPETRSTRTCCLIPASNICTSPGRKGSDWRTPPPASAHHTPESHSTEHFQSFISSLVLLFDQLFRLTHCKTSVSITSSPAAHWFIHPPRFNLLCLFIRLPLLRPFIFQSPSFSASTQEPSERYWLRNELIKCTSRGLLALIKTRDDARPAWIY